MRPIMEKIDMSNPVLKPNGVNYLQPSIVFNQLTNNYKEVELAAEISAPVLPKIILDGSGLAQVQGSLTVTDASPRAGQSLFSLGSDLVPQNDCFFPVTVLRAGDYVPNAIKINKAGSSISSVTVTTAGSYATLPTPGTLGPGSGASLVNVMKAVSSTDVAAGTGYVPADTITLAGGTSTAAAVLTVATTKVVSATVQAGGTGGTNGTQTVTGTTGTGTHFQASVTVALGAITAVLSITVAGSYTVNPTSIAAEPVTGAGLTGAALTVVMGVNTATVSTPGSYTVLPSSPVAQASTSGSGTGATFTVLWGLLSVTVSNGGSGFNQNSSFSLSGGGGTGGGAGTLVLTASTGGNATLITAPIQNDVVYLNTPQFLVNAY